MVIVVVIAVMSVIQSLFGIGLLVFGTPTLLLLGFSFSRALAILLPASLTVSLLQIATDGPVDTKFALKFGTWCAVPIALTLAAALWFKLHTSLDILVAGALTAFVIIRLLPDGGARIRSWVVLHERWWLLLMGVVHGLSNLGGGLLTILASASHRDKRDIRRVIAFCYAFMAISQLLILGMFQPSLFGFHQLSYMALSGAIFLLIGRHVFRTVSAAAYAHLLTLFMAAYALLLTFKAAGLF